MFRQRHSPHHPAGSTLRLGRQQVLSQAPATILSTRQEFCRRLLDMAVSFAPAVRIPRSMQVLTLVLTPSIRCFFSQKPPRELFCAATAYFTIGPLAASSLPSTFDLKMGHSNCAYH